MQVLSPLLLLVATIAMMSCLPIARAQSCACGYQDPSTMELFTDAIITYFNESSAADEVVFKPEKSADRYGRDDPGYAGTGQQLWINSQRTNLWEDDFSATWRSAVSYDNTFLANDSMTMRVQRADRRNRIVYGSQFQTRRRDILYGTFRTMVLPPFSVYAGTEFDIELAYNESSVIQTTFFSNDNASDASLSMGYSTKDNGLNPVLVNQSNISPGQPNHMWREYRMDWLPTALSWSNSGTNASTSVAITKSSKHQIPVLPAPFSYKHWSNGSPTGSKGPPLGSDPLAHVRYARLFFNSSIPSRSEQFEQQCAASNGVPVCSTDDWNLRESTAFDLVMTQKQNPPPHAPYHVRPYAWIGFTVSISIFTILFVHALVRRLFNAYITHKSFYKDYNRRHQGSPSGASADVASPVTSGPSSMTVTMPPANRKAQLSDRTDAELVQMADQKVFDDAMAAWNNPDLLAHEEHDSDSESDLDGKEELVIDDPFDHMEEIHTDKEVLPSSSSSVRGYRPPSLQFRQGSSRPGSIASMPSSSDLLSARIQSGIMTPKGQHVSPYGHYPPSPSSSSGFAPSLRHTSIINGSQQPPFFERYDSRSVSDASLNEVSPSIISGEDGLGAPPSIPDLAVFHPHAHMLLEDGTAVPVHWTTPIAEWQPAGSNEQTEAQGGLAKPQMATATKGKEAASTDADDGSNDTFWQRIKYKIFVRKGEGRATASGAARVEYLDGLRGFACMLVSVHHWTLIYYYGFTTPGVAVHYEFERWIRRIIGPIIANGGLNVGIFFVLAARVIANRYLVRGNMQDLAQQILTRVPRLAATITAGMLISYFLIEVGAFYWVSKLPSRTYSVWSYYDDYDHVGVFFNEFLSLWWMQPPTITPITRHYATGVYWTVPVIIQSSWTVYLCALIAREIKKPWKRYGFYTSVLVLEWWSNRYDYFFLGGLFIADLDNRLKYRQLSAKGINLWRGKWKITYAPFAWALFLLGAVITWLTQQRVFNARTEEFAIKADFQHGEPNKWANTPHPYYAPSVQDFIFVMSFFLLCDLSDFVRTLFTLRFWTVFGRNAFSLYLLHGTVFWSVGAAATLHMLAVGIPYWAVMIINFLLCYTMLFVVCEMFTRTFDRWGIMVARALWRSVSGGLGRRLR